ncbi:helix-turn-helix domain-containing protein [Gorillibacterium sp. sgz5001074]|uniref:helix-turn-helix domain-containing protein n=1 Tax=Gorillibacterium sp. sgz5001074 TaxID=3446695 RepID=UPI003F66CCAA
MTLRTLWQKRKSIMTAWLISYSAVLIVPVIMSVAVYLQSSHALESEIHRANDSLLKQVRYSIDMQIDLMKRLNMEITWNGKLQSLMYSNRPASEAQFLAYQLVKDFQTYKTSYASVDEFYVTWNEGDAVLRPGNVRSKETAFDTIHNTGTLRYEQWLDAIRSSSGNGFSLLPHGDSGGGTQTSISYITQLPKDLNGKETGTVVVMADLERFQKALEAVSLYPGSQLLLLNQANQVLMSNLPVTGRDNLLLESLQEGDRVMVKPSGNGDSELFYIQSAVSDLKYVLVIPSRIYWEKAEYVRKFATISILIALTGAGMLTWFFLRRNYTPIRQLVNSLADGVSPAGGTDGNELSFIEQAISSTRSEKERIALQLKSHRHVLRSNLLNRLMKGKLEMLVSYEEAFDSFGIEWVSDQFAVILFAVENPESLYTNLPGIDLYERRRLIQFIITNVVEELAVQRGHGGYVAEMDDMAACLVNLREGGEDSWREDLRWIGTEAQRFLLRFHMHLTVSIGGIHDSLPGAARAYQEALDAMEYKMVVGKQEIITYDDIRGISGDAELGYYYPLQLEQQIINVIKAGHYPQAVALMNEITERNFHKPYVSLTLVRCLLFNLVGTMMKAMNELGDTTGSILGDNPLWMEKIIACDTLSEMQAELQTLLQEVCAFAAAKAESHASKERVETLRHLTDRVIRHIEEHYQDFNLNVNSIGEHFELKGSYLSKLFKDQTGEGLLDYMAKYRIGQAKNRMQANRQESVADIARQVGYTEVATFIRVFKKYEGITPGKFKEML